MQNYLTFFSLRYCCDDLVCLELISEFFDEVSFSGASKVLPRSKLYFACSFSEW